MCGRFPITFMSKNLTYYPALEPIMFFFKLWLLFTVVYFPFFPPLSETIFSLHSSTYIYSLCDYIQSYGFKYDLKVNDLSQPRILPKTVEFSIQLLTSLICLLGLPNTRF